MSDFLYSSAQTEEGVLSRYIRAIYHHDPPEAVYEYHGNWGSIAVSKSRYNGFQPLETNRHIFIVIGGPVLCFTDNRFLTGAVPEAGTRRIFDRYLSGEINWTKDLSGPFAVLAVDKGRAALSCITDLMMFIPAYRFTQNGTVMLGTHVDALANAAGQAKNIDSASVVDFIINNVVTYPYTAYKNIRQCHPASIYRYETSRGDCREKEHRIYWLPKENNPYANIAEAARDLQGGLQDFVNRATESMTHVAHFLSAGEDSRVITGLLPKTLQRDAFVFLDQMNREGHIARKIANAYKADFYPAYRDDTHYLDILPEATDLVGSGHQYKHAHSLKLHKKCRLDRYHAVFGGYLSDSFLKAYFARRIPKKNIFPFLPQFFIPGENRSRRLKHPLFKDEILEIIDRRRKAHLEKIQTFREKSAHEWFVLWPITMRRAIPYFYCNHRLFRIYEPFFCKQVVNISASVPTHWKLNRRLFHKAFRPFLKTGRWIPHGDGRLPYFPWWVDRPVQYGIGLGRRMKSMTGRAKDNQGPWGDLNRIINSANWHNMFDQYNNGFEMIRDTSTIDNAKTVFYGKKLKKRQKVNFLQVLYFLSQR